MNRITSRQGKSNGFCWLLVAIALLDYSCLAAWKASARMIRKPTTRTAPIYSSKQGVVRRYSQQDRVRYQLWNYTWKPDPDKPITRIEVRIGEQKVYVYQGDDVAGESPTTTGKPGHDTPTGHYSVLLKDIDHKSNLYGVFHGQQRLRY